MLLANQLFVGSKSRRGDPCGRPIVIFVFLTKILEVLRKLFFQISGWSEVGIVFGVGGKFDFWLKILMLALPNPSHYYFPLPLRERLRGKGRAKLALCWYRIFLLK